MLCRHVREQADRRGLQYKLENILKNNPMLVLQGFEKDEVSISPKCKNVSKALVKKYLDLLSIQINSLFPTLPLDTLQIKLLNRLILVKATVEPNASSPLGFQICLSYRHYYLNVELQVENLLKQSIEYKNGRAKIDEDLKVLKLQMKTENESKE